MGLKDNKSPWAKSAAINTDTAPALDAMVNRRFATQYLAERLPLGNDTMRELLDKTGKKLKTACDNGKLVSSNGSFLFGDLAEWARSRKDFAQAVADIVIPATGWVNAVMPAFSARAFGFSLPATLSECQTALADAYRDLNDLREENHSLRATVAALTPLQTKAKARSEAAKRSGQQGGRGNRK